MGIPTPPRPRGYKSKRPNTSTKMKMTPIDWNTIAWWVIAIGLITYLITL